MQSLTRFTMIIYMICMVFSPTAYATESEDSERYLIQPGDLLDISVWREEGLAREVIVRPDGFISFPLVGDIHAAGMSVDTLRQTLSERISRYIPDPVVNVAIVQLLGNQIYVIGKVNRPGSFPVSRSVDVVQVLAMAGGMTPYAAANKIKVLRRDKDVQTAIEFSYGDIEKGHNLEQNIILQAGDIVLVP